MLYIYLLLNQLSLVYQPQKTYYELRRTVVLKDIEISKRGNVTISK